MTTHLLLPYDHVLIHIHAIEVIRPKLTACELCYSREARQLKNGARLCDKCRVMLREMQEVGE